jgi:nucleoside permease NupC
MDAPWTGEKVNLIIRCLAIVFVICAIIAFGIILIGLLERDYAKFPNLDFGSIIGVISAPYCFLLFLKVALTGYAPKYWIPWK